MTKFGPQFWPALIASVISGLIVLFASAFWESYSDDQKSQSGRIIYSIDSVQVDDHGTNPRFIKLINNSDDDLRDFRLFLPGFLPEFRSKLKFYISSEDVVLSDFRGIENVGEEGVMKIDIERFGKGAELTMSIIGPYAGNEITTSERKISMEKLQRTLVPLPSDNGKSESALDIFSALLAIITASIAAIFIYSRKRVLQ